MSGVRRRGPPGSVEQPVGRRAKGDREPAPEVTASATEAALDLSDTASSDAEVRVSGADKGAQGGLGEPAGVAGELQSLGGAVHDPDITNRKKKRQGSDVDLRIGANVRRIRKALDMRQAAIAAMVGCHPTRVTQLEGGEQWTVEIALRLADALGVGLMDLVDEERSPMDVLMLEAVRTRNWRALIQAASAALQTETRRP